MKRWLVTVRNGISITNIEVRGTCIREATKQIEGTIITIDLLGEIPNAPDE